MSRRFALEAFLFASVVAALLGAWRLAGAESRVETTPPELPRYRPSGARVTCDRTRVIGIGCYLIRIPTGPTGCFVTFVAAKPNGALHMPFSDLVRRSPVHPLVAVAGTYFDCKSWLPTGDIIVDRQEVWYGGIGHALGVYPDKHTDVLAAERNRHFAIRSLRSALRSGPWLIQDSKIRRDYRAQGFSDPAVISRIATRCAVGIRRSGHETVLLVALQSVSLETLSRMFQVLRCEDALNLDGGDSLSLFQGGLVRISPGRQLTNIVVAF